MILVAVEIVLVTVTCLTIVPAAIVALCTYLDARPADLPVARLLRKRKTGRRFQRPAFQQLS